MITNDMRPEGDLNIALVASTTDEGKNFYAFNYSGQRIIQQMGCRRLVGSDRRQSRILTLYDGFLAALRSLTVRDKQLLIETAKAENRPVKIVVSAIDKYFIEGLDSWIADPAAVPVQVARKDNWLLDRIDDFLNDLVFDTDLGVTVICNRVTSDYVFTRHAFIWGQRVLSNPHEDSESRHKLPTHYSTVDKRAFLRPPAVAETATITVEEVR